MRRFLAIILLFFSVLVGISDTSAQITVNGVIVHFKAGQRPVQNVVVGNSSKDPGYVVVSVDEILNPAEGGGKTAPSTDLLASPKSFSIEGNGQRTARLVLKKVPGDLEKVYQVSFAPQDRGFGEEVERFIEGRRAVIRVLTGVGILVFVDPVNPKTDLSWSRSRDSIVFTNAGNVHAHLNEGKSCNAEGTDCVNLPTKRVYGGTSFEVKVSAEKKVTYLKRDGASGGFQTISIEPLP